MIRRFYVMPLDADVADADLERFVSDVGDSDRFIPGLVDSFAAVDRDSRTVVWEMSFVDEETYTGPYMVHPYHISTLDNYLLGDSPERVVHDIGATRYRVPLDAPRLERGVRRILLMSLPDGADTTPLQKLATPGAHVATSVFSADDLGWRSAKGLVWTHIWEQGFTDMAALNAYLRTPEGIASSQRDGLRRLGVTISALKVLTYPFSIKSRPTPEQTPPDTSPILCVLTTRTKPEDADAFLRLLEGAYDQVLAAAGAKLLSRLHSVEQAYAEHEIQSTWQFDSFDAFRLFRSSTAGFTDPVWNHFVADGMPLVTSGTRRFYRAV